MKECYHSLKVETYLSVDVKPLRVEEQERVKSLILDGAVRRRGTFQPAQGLDDKTMVIVTQLGRIEDLLEGILRHFHKGPNRNFAVQKIGLASCYMQLFTPPPFSLAPGTLVELRFYLATHSLDEIVILGEVIEGGPTPGICISFLDLAPDQHEWLVRYLMQRQREQAIKKIED